MPKITKRKALDCFEEWLFSVIEDRYGHDGCRKLLAGIVVTCVRSKDREFFSDGLFRDISKLIGCQADQLRDICIVAIDDHAKLYNGIKNGY